MLWWAQYKKSGEKGIRGWDGWMASPMQWTWTWANAGKWWRTWRPGVLQSMGLQRAGHNRATEPLGRWTTLWRFQVDLKGTQPYISIYSFSPKLPSHKGCHITLSRVPCTVQKVLSGYPFKYSSVYPRQSILKWSICLHSHPPYWRQSTD